MHQKLLRAVCFFCALWMIAGGLFTDGNAFAAPAVGNPTPTYTVSEREADGGVVILHGERAMIDFALTDGLEIPCEGWLYQESSGLSGAVMQNSETVDYGSRGLLGKRLESGGNFYLPYDAENGLKQPVVRVYGGTENGGPGASLRGYAAQTYYDVHPTIRVLTRNGDFEIFWFAGLFDENGSSSLLNVPQDPDDFDSWVSAVVKSSTFVCSEDAIPAAGERLFILQSTRKNGLALIGTMRPIRYETERTVDLSKVSLDQHDCLNRDITLPGIGTFHYWAQNDPCWDSMRYESSKAKSYRNFGGGACGPTSAAIVIGNLVPEEDLPRLKEYAANSLGTLICECSINRLYCSELHVPYQLNSAEEYARYLPLAVGDYVTGNNTFGIVARRSGTKGTSMSFLSTLCTDIYGLNYRAAQRYGLDKTLEIMKGHSGDVMCLCVASVTSPFTRQGHFVVIAGCDDEYLYVLDPLYRTEYVYDRHNVVEVLEAGAVRIKLADRLRSGLVPVALVERKGGTVLSVLEELPEEEISEFTEFALTESIEDPTEDEVIDE